MDQARQSTTDNELSGDIVSVHRQIVEEFEKFEVSFRKNWPISWLASLVGPFIVTGLVLLALYFVWGGEFVQKIVAHGFLTFFVFGRLIILGGGENAEVQLSPGQLFWMVTYMDLMVAIFVACHMGIAFRIPFLGKILAELVGDGHFLLKKNPWILRIAYLGLVVFVVFPTSTTGSVGGSIFGRLLGLTRWTTVSAIAIGSILGNGLMYFLSEKINQSAIKDNVWLKLIGLVVLVSIFFLLERRYRSMKKRFIEEELQAKRQTKEPSRELA